LLGLHSPQNIDNLFGSWEPSARHRHELSLPP
jgi:hypothetical protein